MKLWTIQTEEFYKELKSKGTMYGSREFVWDEFIPAYNWMISQMNKRIGECYAKSTYPLWAWYQYDSVIKPKPDLRESGFLEKGTKGVRIEFEKSSKEVLLSDFHLWGHTLNYWYIADIPEEHHEFYRLMSKEGVGLGNLERYNSSLKKVIERSWGKIFKLDYDKPYATTRLKRSEKSIQATFWSLSLDEVKKVDYFVAR